MHRNQLIRRDLAFAAFLGALPSNFGAEEVSDFGSEFAGEDDFSPFGEESPFGVDFAGDGDPDFGYDMSGFGGPPARTAVRAPAGNAAALAAWKRSRTMARGTALFPNKGSAIDVERYVFTISEEIEIGTSESLSISGKPDTKLRAQRVTMNAPCEMFAFVTSLRVANVNITVGDGVEDAFNYNPRGQAMSVDLPTLSPSNSARFLGDYTGLIPPGYEGGLDTHFTVSFRGPATLAAG